MRFMRGTKVEVLSKREVPSGAWRKAEIISGNGHYYRVRYDKLLRNSHDAVVESVSRKVIRPCPPSNDVENWVAGDIVDVFGDNSWKIARVMKAAGGNYFFVRLLGASLETRVHKSDIRVRQYWKDDQWVVIGKISGRFEGREVEELPKKRYCQNSNCKVLDQDVNVKACTGNHHFLIDNVISFHGPQKASSRRMKRGLEPLSACSLMETGWKKRAIEKESRCRQLVSGHPSRLLEKVDAVASPQSVLGENYMHASFNNRMTGFSEIGSDMGKQNFNERYFVPTSLEPNNAESSDCCSVASCGSSNCDPFLSHHFVAGPNLDTDGHTDDAESSIGSKNGRVSFPTKEELTAEIHKLELDAYRSTMMALYASGPLSWEQEAMMTNLRVNLNISNDEYLSELRHLVSTEIVY